MACEETRELAPELALGLVDGEDRARALRHLAECADCRRAVEELSVVVDELLLLAPRHEPPAGFESRVLAQITPPRRERRWRRVFVPLAAAGAAAALATGIVLGATGDDRRLADQYRATLAAANGSSFEATRLVDADGRRAGLVYGYRGRPSWIYLSLYGDRDGAGYRVELELADGRRVPLPRLQLDPATGSGGQAIPVDLQQVARVRLVGPDGVLAARLPHPEP
jgi:putative zinc finger protein